MIDVRSKFAAVPALTTIVEEWIVPAGETWKVTRFEGAAAYDPTVEVVLVWDPHGVPITIGSTHGDAAIQVEQVVVGDGVKFLRIALVNGSLSTKTIGASYRVQKLTVPA